MFRNQTKTSKSLTLKSSKSPLKSLDKVPEQEEDLDLQVDAKNAIDEDNNNLMLSSLTKRNRQRLEETIVDLFRKPKPLLNRGELTSIHQLVKHMLASQAGPLLFDYLKTQILPRGMNILVESLERFEAKLGYVRRLCQIWDHFYTEILPLLSCVFYTMKKKGTSSVRQMALLTFRDQVLLRPDIEHILSETANQLDSSAIGALKQMLLIVHGTSDGVAPSKNRLKLENMVILFNSPFMGFRGLYVDSVLTVKSSENLIGPRKSIDLRRISRPFTVQPRQAETLNELFLQAIKRKHKT